MSHKIPTPTPCMDCKNGDFAKVVLTVTDPIMSEYIAKKYLENAKLITDVRGVKAFTGTYKTKPVSVMSAGMGIPSSGIYEYELYNGYEVDSIIHISSASKISDAINTKDIIVATGACTNSNYASGYRLKGTISGVASFDLLKKVDECVKLLEDQKVVFGQVITTDSVYSGNEERVKEFKKMGVLACEMECYGLYLIAAREGKKAVGLYVVSDSACKENDLVTNEEEKEFDNVVKLALEVAVSN